MGLFKKKVDLNQLPTITSKLKGGSYYKRNYNQLTKDDTPTQYAAQFIEEPSHRCDDNRNNVIVCVGGKRIGYVDENMFNWYHANKRRIAAVNVILEPSLPGYGAREAGTVIVWYK